jgi:HEAT repeat protein
MAQQPGSPTAEGGGWFGVVKRDMQDPDEQVRAGALARLIELGSNNPDAVTHLFVAAIIRPEVRAAVNDKSPIVRKNALAALGLFPKDNSEAIPVLVGALADDDPGCREAAFQSLDSLPPVDRLDVAFDKVWEDAVGHQDVGVSRTALRLLRRHPQERAAFVVKLARAAMKDGRAGVRTSAIELLRHTNVDVAAATVSDLIAMLDDSEVDVRREAISTLQWLGPDAVPAVRKLVEVMLEDPEKAVRDVAVLAALRIDRESALIFRTLADKEGEATRQAVVHLLSTAGAEGRALRRRLQAHWSAGRPEDVTGERQAHRGGQPADGPEAPCGLRWQGKRYAVPPVPYKLLELMWDRKGAEIAEVAEAVWGDPAARTQKVKSALHKVNAILEEARVPWRYRQKQGDIIKEELPGGC